MSVSTVKFIGSHQTIDNLQFTFLHERFCHVSKVLYGDKMKSFVRQYFLNKHFIFSRFVMIIRCFSRFARIIIGWQNKILIQIHLRIQEMVYQLKKTNQAKEINKDWKVLGNILDRLFFIIFILFIFLDSFLILQNMTRKNQIAIKPRLG